MNAAPVPAAHIGRAVLLLRGHKILLDADVAALYEVQTRVLERDKGALPFILVFSRSPAKPILQFAPR